MNSTEAIAACPFHAGHASAPVLPRLDFFDPAFKADPHRAWAALRRQQTLLHRTIHSDGRPW